MNSTKQTAQAFFYEHAGHSYNPSTETVEQGRMRCASELAKAEAFAASHGWRFEWSQDYDDNEGSYRVWQCICVDTDTGEILASLGGIDLSDDTPFQYGVGLLGSPTFKPRGRPPYCRVIEAELALEAMPKAD